MLLTELTKSLIKSDALGLLQIWWQLLWILSSELTTRQGDISNIICSCSTFTLKRACSPTAMGTQRRCWWRRVTGMECLSMSARRMAQGDQHDTVRMCTCLYMWTFVHLSLSMLARKMAPGDHHGAVLKVIIWAGFLGEGRLSLFLDTHVSLAPTHVSPSVRPSVRNTFEFPFYQRLWLLYVKSWRERTPIIFRCASISSTYPCQSVRPSVRP